MASVKWLRAHAVAVAATIATQAASQESVTFVTDFGDPGRHAYYFVALEKG